MAACDKFIYTEILRPEPEQTKDTEGPALPPLKPMVLAALGAVTREDGWAALGPVGSQMTKNQPSFDPRNYGFSKLGELMRKQPYLEVKEVASEGAAGVHLHVRLKQASASKS